MEVKKTDTKNSNLYYERFRKGEISLKEAINAILVLIYKHKAYFGLQKMGEDDFNEFLVYLFPVIEICFEKYDSNQGQFTTFLQSLVRKNKKNFDRSECIKAVNQKYLKYIAKIDCNNNYENNLENTIDFENPSKINNFSNKQILIIALKCSYFLDDEKIEKIAKKTGYNERYIWHLKNTIDKEMRSRYDKNKKRIESLNKNFYLKQKAAMYASFKPKEYAVYERAKYLKKFHTERWEKNKEKTNFRFIVPTNALLAEILGIKETVIANIVVKSKKQVIKLNL